MSYRLKPGQPVTDSLHRIATGQLDYALAQLSSGNGTAIHETRKAIKRLRALLALVRPGIAKARYRQEQDRLRAAANALSGARDAEVMVATAAKLEGHNGKAAIKRVSATLREHLHAHAEHHADANTGKDTATALLGEARGSLAKLKLDDDTFAPVAAAFEENYRRTRRAFAHALRDGADHEDFHDWRKGVQRHWRQLRLVAAAWPEGIRPHILLARDMSKTLGDYNDVSVLARFADAQRKELGRAREVDGFLALCLSRQSELRQAASRHGARLLAEKPGAFARRLCAYWESGPAKG